MMMRSMALAVVALSHAQAVSAQDYAFTADPKGATEFTVQANQAVYNQLDFDDRTSFADIDRGFIAPLQNDGMIEGSFDAKSYNFMQDRDAPDTVNPSLWRHAQLVNRGASTKFCPTRSIRSADRIW